MPLPLLKIEMVGAEEDVPGSMVTSNRSQFFESRNRLSEALTKISSKILIKAGTSPNSFWTMRKGGVVVAVPVAAVDSVVAS